MQQLKKVEYNITATASKEYKTLLTERLNKGKELIKFIVRIAMAF